MLLLIRLFQLLLRQAALHDDTGKIEDSQVLATPDISFALELSGCQQIEFEVRDDSPGLRYTAPDGSKKWTPVVVSCDCHKSEFKVVDSEGIPKNVSFQLAVP